MELKRLGALLGINDIGKESVPKHMLVTLEDRKDEELAKAKSYETLFGKRNEIIISLIETQAKLEMPVMTLQLLSPDSKSAEHLLASSSALGDLLDALSKSEIIHENQIKVAVLGKWYDLPSKLVDSVKAVVDATADYDRLFLYLCVQYSGHQEIVDACKLLTRRVKAEREDPDRLTEGAIKESLYSSSLIPPELVIKTGDKKIPDTLLWDLPGAKIYFTGRHWSEISKADFYKALNS
jgi:undecaprenyl diphosphate synthase